MPSVSSLTVVNQGTSTSDVINLPTGSAVGDLCILFDAGANSGSIPGTVVPSGWTQAVNTAGANDLRAIISYRVLTAADITAGSVTGMNASASDRKGIVSLRPDFPILSVTVSTPVAQQTSGDPTQQTIAAASAPQSPVVLCGQGRGAAGLTSATGTLVTNGTSVGAGTGQVAHFEIQNTTRADRTYDIGDNGSQNVLQSLYLTIA